MGGGESGYVVPAQSPAGTVVYAGGLWGRLTRDDQSNGSIQTISPWPDFPGGRRHLRYRFQWTFPIAVSPAASHTVYVGANVLFKSTDQGRSWTIISPDLTRHDAEKDAHGVLNDVYGTIFAIAPSPLDAQVIWTGSDDGLVYLTRDGGQHWTNVTPPALQPWSRISSIEAGRFDPGTASGGYRVAYGREKIIGQVVGALRENPGLSLVEISELLSLHRHTIQRALRMAGGFATLKRTAILDRLNEHFRIADCEPLKVAWMDCGFSSSSAFARYIRRVTGRAPSELRAGGSWARRGLGQNGRKSS